MLLLSENSVGMNYNLTKPYPPLLLLCPRQKILWSGKSSCRVWFFSWSFLLRQQRSTAVNWSDVNICRDKYFWYIYLISACNLLAFYQHLFITLPCSCKDSHPYRHPLSFPKRMLSSTTDHLNLEHLWLVQISVLIFSLKNYYIPILLTSFNLNLCKIILGNNYYLYKITKDEILVVT